MLPRMAHPVTDPRDDANADDARTIMERLEAYGLPMLVVQAKA